MTQVNSFPSFEERQHVLEFQKLISNSLSGALHYMHTKFKPINATVEKPLGGWSQFLEEEDPPSVTGTSCVITALIFCGESNNSAFFVPAKNFIINKQCPDGGWSKPSLEASHSLVMTTCQALGALLDLNEFPSSSSIQSAVTWLIAAQNADGGWGYLARDKISDVTSTSYVMKTLARVMSFYAKAKDALAHGQKWLEKVKNPDASWGRYASQSGTLAHTSHAVEALLATGHPVTAFTATQDWILENYLNCPQFQDLYKIQTPRERLSWSHMSQERCLIALMKLGASVTRPEVITTVQAILDRQLNGTYWTNTLNTVPGASWAISEAAASLRLYVDRLGKEAEIIILKADLSEWGAKMAEYDKRISALEEKMNAHPLKARVKQVISFLLRPGIALGILAVILLLVYLWLRLVLNLPSIVDVFMACITIIGFVIALLETRKGGTPHV